MGSNKSNRKPSVAERQRLRQQARQQMESLLQASKIERMTQAEILEDLKRKHHGDIPAPAIWNFMADRRITIHGAGPLARG